LTRSESSERGFTIIEVLVAATILVVGVLGTVTMIDTANGVTNNSKARDGATNLAREIVEVARSLPYDDLTSANLQSSLQAQPGLADINTTTTAWEIDRRAGNGAAAIRYTVEVFACTMDDAKDGARAVTDNATYCNGSVGKGSTAKTDLNPDDFRRVEVDVKWSRIGRPAADCKGANGANVGTGNLCVQQATLVPNPTGGLGPSIRSSSIHVYQCTGAGAASCDLSDEITGTEEIEPPGTGVLIYFDTNQAADQVSFTVNDSAQTTGAATPRGADTTGKLWQLTYPFPSGMVDGTYTVTIQATLLGAQGDPAQKPIAVNLSVPGQPDVNNVQPIAYGFNTRILSGGFPGVTEAQWAPPSDGATDYNGYQLMQVKNPGFNQMPTLTGSGSDDRKVASCTPNTADQTVRSCFDDQPPLNGQYNYYVLALDDPWTRTGLPSMASDLTCTIKKIDGTVMGTISVKQSLFGPNNRSGCPSAMMPVDIDAGIANTPPSFPDDNGTTATGSTTPRIAWTATATDTDGIAFFRIYRTSTNVGPPPNSARIGKSNGSQQFFDDTNPSGSTAYYWVTAVDNKLNESPAIGPVQWP